jgi:hypothetical protein
MHFIFRISKRFQPDLQNSPQFRVAGAARMALQFTLRKKDGKTGIVAENIPSSATARLR